MAVFGGGDETPILHMLKLDFQKLIFHMETPFQPIILLNTYPTPANAARPPPIIASIFKTALYTHVRVYIER